MHYCKASIVVLPVHSLYWWYYHFEAIQIIMGVECGFW